MPEISRVVRGRVRTRLADTDFGFNPTLSAVCAEYGITPPANHVDFLDPKSKSFFQSMVGPDTLDSSTPRTYPLVVLYAIGSQNNNTEKFHLFSGIVTIGLDVHLSWKKGNATDTESLGDAVEETIYRVFHDPTWDGAYTEPVAFNGETQFTRRPLEMAGENWRQSFNSRLTFEVSTN